MEYRDSSCNDVHSRFVFYDLRYTTSPTQSVIGDQKCPISEVGKRSYIVKTVVRQSLRFTTFIFKRGPGD